MRVYELIKVSKIIEKILLLFIYFSVTIFKNKEIEGMFQFCVKRD